MLKKKFLVLLILFGYITTHNNLQSTDWLARAKQQAQQAFQKAQQALQQAKQALQKVEQQQAKMPQQQAQQQVPQQIQQPIQRPMIAPQPIVLPAAPFVQQPVQQQTPAPTPQVQQPIQQPILVVPQPGVFPAAPPAQQQNLAPAPQVQQPIQQRILVVPQSGVFPAAPPIQQAVQQQAPAPAQQGVQQAARTASRLFNFNFGAAGVLPTFVKNGKKYLIISREAGGGDKGTYDDFGGKRDFIGPNQKETPPMVTAAREFFEEAILARSIKMSLQETQNFIDEDNVYTEFVIASGHNVTYITDFTAYADTFFANFYHAYKTTTNRHSREKNSIAIVGWDELKTVVSNTSLINGVTMDAEVLNPTDLRWYREKITLRPFFVKKFRPFWMNKPYKQDLNNKVRFY